MRRNQNHSLLALRAHLCKSSVQAYPARPLLYAPLKVDQMTQIEDDNTLARWEILINLDQALARIETGRSDTRSHIYDLGPVNEPERVLFDRGRKAH